MPPGSGSAKLRYWPAMGKAGRRCQPIEFCLPLNLCEHKFLALGLLCEEYIFLRGAHEISFAAIGVVFDYAINNLLKKRMMRSNPTLTLSLYPAGHKSLMERELKKGRIK